MCLCPDLSYFQHVDHHYIIYQATRAEGTPAHTVDVDQKTWIRCFTRHSAAGNAGLSTCLKPGYNLISNITSVMDIRKIILTCSDVSKVANTPLHFLLFRAHTTMLQHTLCPLMQNDNAPGLETR